MKTMNMSMNKVVAIVVSMIAVLAIMVFAKPITAHAAANEFINNTPTTGTGFIDISTKHLYYNENGDLCAEFYLYNGLNSTIYEINKLHLHLNNGQIDVADTTVEKLSGFSLAPGYYGTFSVVFSGKNDHVQVT